MDGEWMEIMHSRQANILKIFRGRAANFAASLRQWYAPSIEAMTSGIRGIGHHLMHEFICMLNLLLPPYVYEVRNVRRGVSRDHVRYLMREIKSFTLLLKVHLILDGNQRREHGADRHSLRVASRTVGRYSQHLLHRLFLR